MNSKSFMAQEWHFYKALGKHSALLKVGSKVVKRQYLTFSKPHRY